MPEVYGPIGASLDRADALLGDLIMEYDRSLQQQSVAEEVVQLTHEICEKLRGILDRIARRYWEKHIRPALSEEEQDRAKIYFPITQSQHNFDSMMGKWQWRSVRSDHQLLYDFLLNRQPFFNADNNRWLAVLDDLTTQGKHIDLVPQTRTEERRISVSNRGGASVTWNPAGVQFGGPPGSVIVAGAPIDPQTQRIIPTDGVTERIEIWVDFILQGHGLSAARFCRSACANTRKIVDEMTASFGLS